MTGTNCVRYACAHAMSLVSPDEALAALKETAAPTTRSTLFQTVLSARGCPQPHVSALEIPPTALAVLNVLTATGDLVCATTPEDHLLVFGTPPELAPQEPAWMTTDGARAHLDLMEDPEGHALLVAQEVNHHLAGLGLGEEPAHARGASVVITLPAVDATRLLTHRTHRTGGTL